MPFFAISQKVANPVKEKYFENCRSYSILFTYLIEIFFLFYLIFYFFVIGFDSFRLRIIVIA